MAVASVALVAILVAGVLSVWVRTAGSAAGDDASVRLDEPLPESLPDGTPFAPVPAEVAAAAGGAPVVGAVELSELPPGLDGCGMGPEAGEQELQQALITPDGLLIELVGPAGVGPMWEGDGPSLIVPEAFEEGAVGGGFAAGSSGVAVDRAVVQPKPLPAPPPPPVVLPPDAVAVPAQPDVVPVPAEPAIPPGGPGDRMFTSCTATRIGDRWEVTSSSAGPFGPDGPGPGGFEGEGVSLSCCGPEGRGTASTKMGVPAGAVWALQERGSWWLALPVADRTDITISWPYREGPFGGRGSTHVLFVDPQGAVIDERYASA